MSVESLKMLDRFFEYADKSDVKLLEEDKRYIRHISTTVCEKLLRIALSEYLRHWQDGATAEPSEIKKMNAGRRNANTKFREKLGFNSKYKY